MCGDCGRRLATYKALEGPDDDHHIFCPRHTSTTQPTPPDSPASSGVDAPDGPDGDALENLPNGTVILRHDDAVVRTRRVRRWARVLADVTLDVSFGPSWMGPHLLETLERLYNLFNGLLDALGDRLSGRDELQFTIMSPSLEVPIFVPLRRWTELTAGYILDHIERVLQSKAEIPLDAGFTVHVGVFRSPSKISCGPLKV